MAFFFLIFLTAYMSSPCHIELILSEKEEPVQKEVIQQNICSKIHVGKAVDGGDLSICCNL